MISATTRLAIGDGSMLMLAVTRRGLLRRSEVRAALARQIHFTGSVVGLTHWLPAHQLPPMIFATAAARIAPARLR